MKTRKQTLKRVLVVFGTRPEAIKMAPVVMELRKYPGEIETKVCVTAQHREMVDQVMRLFDIRPDYDLDIMQEDQSLAHVTANVLTGVEKVIVKEKPDWILLQGDTTTVMAAALVAFYHRVKVGHVEAGLRTWNKFHPFPEEINRVIADRICDLHFAPTETARKNLLREGFYEASIHVTGNTVIDALRWVVTQPLTTDVHAMFREIGLNEHGDSSRIILVTAHRRENFGEPLRNICVALKDIVARHPDVKIVYPVHMNPNVKRVAHEILGGIPGITLLGSLEYLPMVQLINKSYLVLTDSGGLQEEAPGLGKPVLVLREVTERPEAVEAGTARVVGTGRERILAEASRLLQDSGEYRKMAHAVNPYGDGKAAERIVSILMADQQIAPIHV